MPDPGVFSAGFEVDLAAMQHGGFVVAASDMFFGERQNLILPGRALNMGDGWETRRRRGPGHDWSIVRLAARGTLTRVEIDTDWYKGNAPGSFMLEWCDAPGASADVLSGKKTRWTMLIPETPLEPDGRHEFELEGGPGPATHVRLNIYPDGGIARLRVFGTVPQPG
jgi:allantoicase